LLLHGLLKGEVLVINKKRTYRVYTEESLQVRTKAQETAAPTTANGGAA
jgi:putative transposase